MLAEWTAHDRLDSAKIGMFGFSAGGTTVLLKLGGVLDLALAAPHCSDVPADPVCRYRARPDATAPSPARDPSVSGADPRIRAAVAAAPALGFAFVPDTIAHIAVPRQLWRGEADEVLLQPWHAEAIHAVLPAGHQYEVVSNAGHYAFLAVCGDILREHVPEICTDPPGFDRAAFHITLNRSVVAFFRTALDTR